LAPCGWRCPHRRLTLIRPVGNGIVVMVSVVHVNLLLAWGQYGGKLSKAVHCLACCWLGQPVSTWQVEMGWPGIHWLAGDEGEWAGGSRMF
jgi:hypothetical protein